MYTLRTRIGKDIVAEFLPPASYWKRKKGKVYKDKVIILADGMPTVPSKKGLIEFLSKKGYWVFYPRYRGCWESGGVLFARSPHEDIFDVVEVIHKGTITELFEHKLFALTPSRCILVGSSFGGAASLIASRDQRVDAAVTISPLVDWQSKSSAEPIEFLARFTKEAFGSAYRPSKNAWKRVASGTFFNPVRQVKDIDGRKILMIHAKDDDVVTWRPVAMFAKRCKAKIYVDVRGGHMGLSTLMKPKYWKRVEKFLKS